MKIQVPVIRKTDVLVIGGTAAACHLASALRRKNRSVFCVTPYTYFGEELCARLDFAPEKLERLNRFGITVWNRNPAGIKQLLDSVLISAGVEYLYQNNPVAPLFDAAGCIRGCLFAGRSGFFAVAARAVVDASANSVFAPAPARSGRHTVTLNVIGGAAAENFDRAETVGRCDCSGKSLPLVHLEKEYDLADGSIAELSRTDLEMRTLAWAPETLRIADECDFGFRSALPAASPEFPVYPDTADADEVAAAAEANGFGTGWNFAEKGRKYPFDAVSFDTLFRWKECETIPFELNSLPPDAEYDVLVCGGGTGGAPAAISAARAGAKTLCVEKLSIPGGICTAGRIASYWFGNCCGFTEEMDLGVGAMAPADGYVPLKGHSPMERKGAWLTRELFRSGSEVRFNTLCVGAAVQGRKVCGAILAGPWGVTLAAAKAAVDASGNADLVAAAGGPTRPLVEAEPAVQGAGLPPYELDKPCFNTDYLFSCDSDTVDATASFTMAHDKFANHFDVAQILDTRERRRIVGELELQPQDFFAHRRYGDTVVIARSNFDTHGFVLHPMFLLKPAEHQPYYANVPFRALLPKAWEGVLATGLGVSAHRDCMPLIRMQPDVQNQGYAAGLAAATAALEGKGFREIAIRELQRKLVSVKILPETILTEVDSCGGFEDEDTHKELADLFLAPQEAEARLLAKFAASPDLETAELLAFLGNPAGTELLEQTIRETAWDSGWAYRGMGQFGRSASPLDVAIMAYRHTGGDAAPVLEKLKALTPAAEFSHFRAVSLYFTARPCPEAIPELERLLQSEGFRGHAFRTLSDVLDGVRGSVVDTTVRNAQLKELYTAKALKACDPGSRTAAETLRQYREGMQSCYALFAAD